MDRDGKHALVFRVATKEYNSDSRNRGPRSFALSNILLGLSRRGLVALDLGSDKNWSSSASRYRRWCHDDAHG